MGMDKFVRMLLSTITAVIAVWGIGSFVTMQGDFTKWSNAGRMCYLIAVALWMFISFIVIKDEE